MMSYTPFNCDHLHGTPKHDHKQVKFRWQGEVIEIDRGMAKLLRAINLFPRIATTSSCICQQYAGEGFNKGFITWTGESPEDVKLLAEVLTNFAKADGLDLEVSVSQWPEDKPENESVHMGVVRWRPDDKQRLLVLALEMAIAILRVKQTALENEAISLS